MIRWISCYLVGYIVEYSTTIYFEELWLAKFPALKILLLVNFFCEVENKGVQFTDLKDLQSNGQGMTNLFLSN